MYQDGGGAPPSVELGRDYHVEAVAGIHQHASLLQTTCRLQECPLGYPESGDGLIARERDAALRLKVDQIHCQAGARRLQHMQ